MSQDEHPEREDEGVEAPNADHEGGGDADALPAEPTDDDAALGDTDEHSGSTA